MPSPKLLCALLFAFFVGPAHAEAAPETPRGAAMTANSADSITVTWYRAPKNDAESYNVYNSTNKDGPYEKLTSVTSREMTHGKLAPATRMYYRIAAVNKDGESAQSEPVEGFTIQPAMETPFPVKLARNMCLTLGSTIISEAKPLSGTLEYLVDGSDATGCRLRRNSEIRIKLDPAIQSVDADYLMVHFRTDCGPHDWSNDKFARTFKKYTILESKDSTDGKDGTWQEIKSGTNPHLDAVFVIPNHQPRWIAVRNDYGPNDEVPKPDDKRLMPGDLILSRLDVFRSAPKGYRNDYWIFTGDSLVVGDMPAGTDKERKARFSDLIREKYPDRYPMVVHIARGGQMLKDTQPMVEKALPELSPPNGTDTPTGTVVCWETGFNDVGVGGSLALGNRLIASYESARSLCERNGLIMVPVRIEFSTKYLDPATLEPVKNNVFFNTLAVNLGGVDVFCRESTPYACDPATQLPYADYWTYTRNNHATALAEDGVHHTKAGCDGINQLWADTAGKMIYSRQK